MPPPEHILAARAPQTGRVRADHGGRRRLPGRGLHPTHGQADRYFGHQLAFEVTGLTHGGRARRARRLLPQPAPGRRRPLHLRSGRRPDHEGPRSAVVLTATGVNADGHREVLGLRVATPARAEQRGTSSSPTWSPEAWEGYDLSPLTPTRVWSRPSPRTCPERPGSAAAPTTPPT